MARKKKRSKLGYSSEDVFTWDDVALSLSCFGIPEREFTRWFNGQTGVILPNGKLGYFRWDIERFTKAYLQCTLRGLR
jgi:hypothetical protein